MNEPTITDCAVRFPTEGRIYIKDESGVGVRLVWSGTPEELDAIAETFQWQLKERIKELENIGIKQQFEISQTLGKALGYAPMEGEPGGCICVGEHTAETLAMEAARKIATLEATLKRVEVACLVMEARVYIEPETKREVKSHAQNLRAALKGGGE